MALNSSPAVVTDPGLKRSLGVVGLTAIGFSNIVGSGWLFSSMYAARIAGPASLLAWVGAGVLCMLIAWVMVALGAGRPEGGGTVRWPLQSSGRLVGSVVGVSVLLTVGGTAAEITAILKYAAHYVPSLYADGNITSRGVVVAMLLSVVLSALNWYGVRLFARLNNVLTVVKIVVPLLTVAALLASGFHPSRLTEHGGFAPYGYAAVLSALSTGGIVYSVNGFQAAADFSGEARNPRRDVPRAIIAGIGLAVLVYLLLQLVFLFAVPESRLANGWHGVDFESPFGQLALILNLQWLSVLLYADAVISPGGSGYVGVAIDGRHTYALAKNGVLPRFFLAVEERSGIPRRALALNLAVILVFLLPLGGWQQVVAVVGDLYLLTYAAVAVSAGAFQDQPNRGGDGWIPDVRRVAPVSFVVATEFVYWSGWHELWIALGLTLLGVPLFLVAWRRWHPESLAVELRRGAWVVCYVVALLAISRLGSFGGGDVLSAPADSILVAVVGALTYAWAVRSSREYLRQGEPADRLG